MLNNSVKLLARFGLPDGVTIDDVARAKIHREAPVITESPYTRVTLWLRNGERWAFIARPTKSDWTAGAWERR